MTYESPLAIERLVIGMAASLARIPDDALSLSSVRREQYRRAGIDPGAAFELDGEALRRERIRRSVFAL